MATSKVVKVTSASVGTGDTLASYNVYSDQDGLLGNLTAANAADPGLTVSLTDGLVHDITAKPVGTSSGEYNAPSNAVEVDLSGGSSIVFSDDFTGSTIDTAKWTIVNPTPSSISITQNNEIIYSTLNNTGDSPLGTDYIISKTGLEVGTGTAVFSFDLYFETLGSGPSSNVGISKATPGNTRADIFRIGRSTTENTITFNATVGDVDESAANVVANCYDVYKTFKIKFIDGACTFYHWDGSSWDLLNTRPSTYSGVFYIWGAAQNNLVKDFKLDNVYITNTDFTTQYPA